MQFWILTSRDQFIYLRELWAGHACIFEPHKRLFIYAIFWEILLFANCQANWKINCHFPISLVFFRLIEKSLFSLMLIGKWPIGCQSARFFSGSLQWAILCSFRLIRKMLEIPEMGQKKSILKACVIDGYLSKRKNVSVISIKNRYTFLDINVIRKGQWNVQFLYF